MVELKRRQQLIARLFQDSRDSPASPGVVSPGGPAAARRLCSWAARRRRALIGWSVLAAAFIVCTVTLGIPLSEDTVLIWLAAVLFVVSLDDLENWRARVLRDWLPLYAVLLVYSLLRGYASHVLWGPFVRPELAVDRLIGLGAVPTVQLQQWLFDPSQLHWWDYAAWMVYNSHFFASYMIAAVLWKRNHDRFRRFIGLYVGLTFVGYAGYVFYPAMPPWMASEAGHLVPTLGPAAPPYLTIAVPEPSYLAVPTGYPGATARIIPLVWQHVGLKAAAALFTHGSEFANNVAAMPSLHAAYPMLILLFFWSRARRTVRALLVGYVLAMAFTLVYTGEHFVTDELAGWACAIAVYFAGSRLLDRRAQRRGSGHGGPGGDGALLDDAAAAASPIEA
ncbi:MAG: phosphatase PAP2 family protein [Streptosporangiaceae bacterium]